MTGPENKQPESDLSWVVDDDEVRNLLLTLWRRARMDWSFVSRSLADAFRSSRLSSRQRRAVAECLYGMIRHHRRIDEALRAGGFRSRERAPDAERVLAYLVLEQGLSANAAARRSPELDWDAVAAVDATLERIADPVERLARRHSLPDWLAARLSDQYGDEAAALARALGERAPMAVRVNTLRTTRDELAAALAERGIVTRPSALSPDGLIFETRLNLFSLDEFRRGLFEAQDEGSQLIAELVMPPPKAAVVDFCAGAGGKTLAIAAHMGSKGRIVAADPFAKKLAELRRRARRAGASNIQAVEIDAGARAPLPPAVDRLTAKVERVLVDAPCTGIGSLRRNPEARWRLSEREAAELPAQQLAICERALPLLAPGGRLIYATCTVLRAENRDVVETLLNRHAELELVPVKEVWGRERAEAMGDGVFLETLPHRHGCDGFFAAVLRRRRRASSGGQAGSASG